MVLRGLVLTLAIASPLAARAADALPLLSGRWSSGDCARADAATTRWFGPDTTASFNDRCRIAAQGGAGRIWRAHLSCHYREARDDADDVVIEVASPMSLRWVDQCTATAYHFCTRGGPPAAFEASPR